MRKDAVWLILSRIAGTAAQLGLLGSVAVLLSQQAAAELVLALALTAPIFMFADMGMVSLYLSLRARPLLSDVGRARALATGVAVTVVVLLALVGPAPLWATLLVALIKTVDQFADLAMAGLHEQGDARSIFGLSVLNVSLTTGGASAVILLGAGLNEALAMSLGSSIMVVWLAWRRLRTADGPGALRPRAALSPHRILISGIPLGLAMGLASLILNAPQYWLARHGTQGEVLYFALVVYAITAVQLVIGGLAQSYLLNFSHIVAQQSPTEIRRIVGRTTWRLALAALPVAGAGVLGIWVLDHVVGINSRPGINAAAFGTIVVSLPAALASGVMLNALNRYARLLVSNLLAALTVIASALWLVPAHTLSAALVAVALGFVVRAALLMGNLHHEVSHHHRPVARSGG